MTREDAIEIHCLECGQPFGGLAEVLFCESFRSLMAAQQMIDAFGPRRAGGGTWLFTIVKQSQARGEKIHVYCRKCFRGLKRAGWFSRKRTCRVCGEEVS